LSLEPYTLTITQPRLLDDYGKRYQTEGDLLNMIDQLYIL